MDKWLNCTMHGFIPWPAEQTAVKYNEDELVLMPSTDDSEPSLHVRMTMAMRNEDAMTIANRFLSVLSWKYAKGVDQISDGDITAVHHPFPRNPGFRYIHALDPFPRTIVGPRDQSGQLALSLFREGQSLRSVPYQFLSFFKVLNIKCPDRKLKGGVNPLRNWIALNYEKVTSAKAKERIAEIKLSGQDVPDYIYQSCRCAIAHSNTLPVVDPDNIEDIWRIRGDMILISGLAEHLIENELKISKAV
jgi:hypothetical protein